MAIRIVPPPIVERNPLVPDLVWDGETGDFLRTDASDTENPFGLRAQQLLATAVLICLMSDRAVEPEALRDGDEQKGWAGDAFDIEIENGERPLGSRLWQLRRNVLEQFETPRFAEYACREALQTLVDQGAVAAWSIAASADMAAQRLDIDIVGVDRTGRRIYDRQWRILWRQLDGVERPLAR